MNITARSFPLTGIGPYFAALLALAVLTFWPTYVSLSPSQSDFYTHFHAAIATLWVLLLIAQPMLIRSGRNVLHRRLGKVSLVVAPVFVLAAVLLAHSRMQGLEGPRLGIQTYVLWLQISLVSVYALSYTLAMITRRDMALHARFMICTGLTLIDPVVIRLMLWIDNSPSWNFQWFTFLVTNLILLYFIWLERKVTTGRWVFPFMLVVFLLAQVPALFGLTNQAWWQSFAQWFAALPLT